MAQQTDAPRLREAFTYTPGDGHRYSWSGGQDTITVELMATDPVTGLVTFTRTGDAIPAPELPTASALARTVDTWRLHYGE